MEIIVGKTAGFCYGVKRAIDFSKEALSNNKNVYSIGSIVHNKVVNKDLEDRGLIFKKGEILRKVDEKDLLNELMKEIDKL